MNLRSMRWILLGLSLIIISGLLFYMQQQSSPKDSSLPSALRLDIGGGLAIELVLIQPGAFTMGSSTYIGENDEFPAHQVTITEPFYLGKYEVTQAQWEELLGSNPSEFKGNDRPVDSVSWEDAQLLIQKLQEKTGRTFALPTEAQWEYAARAGTSTRWDWGNNEAILGDYAWFEENSSAMTHPVGQKKPNHWGLYDMYGNVQEWCNDWYAHQYQQEAVSDPQGPHSGDSRVVRGGAWGDDATMVRASYRNATGTDARTAGIGLRVAMVID